MVHFNGAGKCDRVWCMMDDDRIDRRGTVIDWDEMLSAVEL